MMGRGKTTAAINYMSRWSSEKCFLYITPFLQEVDRVCEQCDFDQPDSDHVTKLAELKRMMRRNRNVASTHSLFFLLDDEALQLARDKHYTLIVDEAMNVVSRVPVTNSDLDAITTHFASVDETDGRITWADPEYTGRFSGYKDLADMGSLYIVGSSLLSIMRPDTISAFDEVIMMTYRFMGQYQRAYLDFFGFQYRLCGVDTETMTFTDMPDQPPAVDFGSLIRIVDDERMNRIGNAPFSLSKAWYDRRSRNNDEMRELRNDLNSFFRRRVNAPSGSQLWTCFKSDAPKLYGVNNRFASSFLHLSAKASNAYRERTAVAYLVNRFVDPNIGKFFATHGVQVDMDEFALGEMLQWIWRSAVRDGRPIDLYIPSKRMRDLLMQWIETMNNGGDANG